MRRRPFKLTGRLYEGLSSFVLLANLVLPLPLIAQATPALPFAHGLGPVYDAAHEITVKGDIQQVVTEHKAGSPAGMHLIVRCPGGLFDTHVGPFLSDEVKDALHTGTPVQIAGATVEIHGKQYLLARELTVGGRTVTIRSEHGVLVVPHPVGARHTQAEKSSQPEPNGGAR
jgi:hypothetical protein